MTEVLPAVRRGDRRAHGPGQTSRPSTWSTAPGTKACRLGELAGASIPRQAAEHYYLLTEPIEGVDGGWPVLEDPANYGYYREEGGGLMLGLFEHVCAPWNVGCGVRRLLVRRTAPGLGPDVPRTWSARLSRVLVAEHQRGDQEVLLRPGELHPGPDARPARRGHRAEELLRRRGAEPRSGILTGRGIGRVVAHWIAEEMADIDVTGINIDRLHRYQANPEYRATRTVESLGTVYATRTGPVHCGRGAQVPGPPPAGRAAAACFKDVSGWEGADWYAPEGAEPEPGELSWEAGLVRLLGGRASRGPHRVILMPSMASSTCGAGTRGRSWSRSPPTR